MLITSIYDSLLMYTYILLRCYTSNLRNASCMAIGFKPSQWQDIISLSKKLYTLYSVTGWFQEWIQECFYKCSIYNQIKINLV